MGDVYQLPPIRRDTVFSHFKNDLLNFCHPWKYFSFYELTETMRQQGDDHFVRLLNNVRVGILTEDDLVMLQTRQYSNEHTLPIDTVFIFAGNSLKDELNTLKLAEIS